MRAAALAAYLMARRWAGLVYYCAASFVRNS